MKNTILIYVYPRRTLFCLLYDYRTEKYNNVGLCGEDGQGNTGIKIIWEETERKTLNPLDGK